MHKNIGQSFNDFLEDEGVELNMEQVLERIYCDEISSALGKQDHYIAHIYRMKLVSLYTQAEIMGVIL